MHDPTAVQQDAHKGFTMHRQTTMLWMKDILEHLGNCFDQWQSADPASEHFLAQSMERDLNEFRRLCEALRHDRSRTQARSTVPA
jgi:hypothetical protein